MTAPMTTTPVMDEPVTGNCAALGVVELTDGRAVGLAVGLGLAVTVRLDVGLVVRLGLGSGLEVELEVWLGHG